MRAEIQRLEGKLLEAESILQAIRHGDVDAVVVSDQAGKNQVYTLESSDRPYRALIEQIQEGAITLGADGTIIYCNKRLASMLGVAQERIVGHGLESFVTRSNVAILSRMLHQAMAAPVRAELSLRCAGDRQMPIYLSLSALRRDDDDGPLLCGVITDLTEQKTHLDDMAVAVNEARVLAAERDRQTVKLAESEANFRMLAENANDVIVSVSRNGERRYVSPAALRVIGATTDELMLHGLPAFIHPADRDRKLVLHNQLLEGSVTQGSATFRTLNPERGMVWVEMSARAVLDPMTHHSMGYVAVLRDVTDRVRLEAERDDRERELRATNTELDRLARHFAKARNIAEQANRAKTRFLAAMSHELRTPLNGILGYAQLLRMDGGLTDVQSQRVQSMLAAGTHLLEMISCVLDLSEIETGGAELQPSAIGLRTLLEACMKMLYPQAEAKPLKLGLRIRPGVPDRVVADPSRLRQVLLNLLGNAVKFTVAGTVELCVQVVGSGARLRFEVVDTGPGINDAQRDRLFEEFARLDADPANSVEGSGLGLALAKQVTKLMGGLIGHEDNPGGGSVFWLELPLVTEPAAEKPALPIQAVRHSDAAVAVPTGPMRILIVDDTAMNRDIAAAFVRSAGYEPVCAEGGAEAVTAASEGDFLAILMDVRMPEVDGLEATRRIRTLDGPRGAVPIIALTAQVFTEQISACREAGMDLHLGKPFTPAGLIGIIQQAVEAARQRPTPKSVPATGRASAGTDVSPGADLPVVDQAAFARTASMLAPGVLASYLRTLAENAAALRQALAEPEAASGDAAALADSAHALAGSAGMFGFKRLVFLARLFEQKAQSDPAQVAGLAPALIASLEAAIEEMHRYTGSGR
jgi:PAS domain S-box-containing protein